VRALVSGRSRTFGLIVSEAVNPFLPEIVHRFTQLGLKHRHQVLLSSTTHDSDECEIAAQQMIERRVDGVAIPTFGSEESVIQALLNHRIPVFAVDLESRGVLLKTVRIDYQHGVSGGSVSQR
jgi:LacI family transcriptional regulator, galactose operon repressor